jgi:hypothetical protein
MTLRKPRERTALARKSNQALLRPGQIIVNQNLMRGMEQENSSYYRDVSGVV